ncbi:hypothetical protein EW145_g3423 [Phellinidium pouzarii]|uniref:Choline/carnitine acyltransferase domain-containing protein n=1 Tax=Phellinidium pouzarii TaxID=167371 RepID=A0A4S4L7E6_9AGAM|nr:hypothetical protein EW145_g3423 [Phellinidium pouzarii]
MSSTRNISDASSASKPLRLPRLPVPLLRDTLDRYLKSLEPLLLEDEARGGPTFSDAMHTRVAWANEFEQGLGKLCQERLKEIDRKSPYNWLDDNFWLKKAYLEWRAPLLVNSNWWLAYKHDHSVPACVMDGADANMRAGISSWQIRRAAWLLSRTLEFKRRFESQEPGTTRTGLWMRNSVPKIFNICRIPHENCDKLSTPLSTSPYLNKVIVILHNWFYALDVCDSHGRGVNHRELERRIRDVVVDVDKRLASGEKAPAIGVLSSDERNNWAKNLGYLLSISQSNRKLMNVIEDSIMALSLDHYTYARTLGPAPSERKSHLHNIRSGISAHNRWFDKGVSLIVENNTRAGMMGEHSPVDALVPSIVADFSLTEDMDADSEWLPLGSFAEHKTSEPDSWERLDWVVNEYVLRKCVEAEDRAKAIIADSDDDVFWFMDYGCDWIRNTSKTDSPAYYANRSLMRNSATEVQVSPDAYIQLAMQLAWYRTRGTFTATYETALTRLFQHGRTETIRTLTTDSRTFVLAMLDATVPSETKCSLLRQAIQTHGRLTKAAATGKGIDRHLLGLRLVMGANESSPLFEDHFFLQSQEWKLSTSGLSAGEYFRGTGFGAPYADGYGVNYLAGTDVIKFGIESKFSCSETSSDAFKDAIFSSLRDMKTIFQCKPSDIDTVEVHRARL